MQRRAHWGRCRPGGRMHARRLTPAPSRNASRSTSACPPSDGNPAIWQSGAACRDGAGPRVVITPHASVPRTAPRAAQTNAPAGARRFTVAMYCALTSCQVAALLTLGSVGTKYSAARGQAVSSPAAASLRKCPESVTSAAPRVCPVVYLMIAWAHQKRLSGRQRVEGSGAGQPLTPDCPRLACGAPCPRRKAPQTSIRARPALPAGRREVHVCAGSHGRR